MEASVLTRLQVQSMATVVLAWAHGPELIAIKVSFFFLVKCSQSSFIKLLIFEDKSSLNNMMVQNKQQFDSSGRPISVGVNPIQQQQTGPINANDQNRFKKAHSGNNWPNNDNAQWPNDNNDWYNDKIWKNNNNMWQPNLVNRVDQKQNPWAVTQAYPSVNPNWQNNGWNIGMPNNPSNNQAYAQMGGCSSYPCLNNGVCDSWFNFFNLL
jgi:hypothetical protein